ncbi:hypothetical protein V2A60_002143 [Cordyceps javanica]
MAFQDDQSPYQGWPDDEKDQLWQDMYSNHCIEVLRESLTCAADVSAIPYRWHHETKIAEPDIRSVHMCRNFTKIREWAFGRFIPMTTKRKHVEDGVVVDYTGVGRDPEEVLAEELANPEGWNKTVNDL